VLHVTVTIVLYTTSAVLSLPLSGGVNFEQYITEKHVRNLFSATPAAESRHGWLHVLRLLFIYFIFYVLTTNYLQIYRTDLRQCFSVCRTMAVGDQSKINFSFIDVVVATYFVFLSTEMISVTFDRWR